MADQIIINALATIEYRGKQHSLMLSAAELSTNYHSAQGYWATDFPKKKILFTVHRYKGCTEQWEEFLKDCMIHFMGNASIICEAVLKFKYGPTEFTFNGGIETVSVTREYIELEVSREAIVKEVY